ncbi:hypothetical protein [Saccharopolyspora pogona]|uniref:hypothetical protein n=1 Tax=Saccharopolyspora pogona TaxID=333966 RepID=UPI001CC24839|nr:hypothetical protein [Saccharopolyspora pogona]
MLNHTDIPLSEIIAWTPRLRRHVDQLLERDFGPNARAGLLQVSAHLALHIDYSDAQVRGSATLAEIDQQYEALMDAIDQGALQQHLDAAPLVDLDGGMRRLLELSDLLPEALAYPIDTFSTVVDLLAPSLRDHPLYRKVCDGLDDAVKRQEGDAAVGDKCRQRATVAEGRPPARCLARVSPGQGQLVPRRYPLRRATGDGQHRGHLLLPGHVPRRQETRTGRGRHRAWQPGFVRSRVRPDSAVRRGQPRPLGRSVWWVEQ